MKKLLIIALILWGCDYAPTEHSHEHEHIHSHDAEHNHNTWLCVIDNSHNIESYEKFWNCDQEITQFECYEKPSPYGIPNIYWIDTHLSCYQFCLEMCSGWETGDECYCNG